ncbi:MAG: ATP-dependent Clp protease ATP-binding subunit ClpX, partial [Lachnospiraceae bacterium]|nr:ATP-dependent Clp protease ATP-binding subunit ClpX [Lachnospiraceae bacterium]
MSDEIMNDNDEYEKVCYICRRTESKTGKMIMMPGDMSICVDCRKKSFDTLNDGTIDYDSLMKFSNMPGVNFM